MIRLLLFRLLPALAAVGIVGVAVSPVRGTLESFGAAADALAGDTDVKAPGISVDPTNLKMNAKQSLQNSLPSAITGISGPRTISGKKAKLLEMAKKADEGDTGEENYGWNAGDRAIKPLEKHGK